MENKFTAKTERLTTMVRVPAFLLRNREQDLIDALGELDALRAENAALRAKIAALEGPDWSRRDSVTY